MEKRNLTLKSSGSGTKDFRLDGKVAIVTGADYPLDGGFFNLRG